MGFSTLGTLLDLCVSSLRRGHAEYGVLGSRVLWVLGFRHPHSGMPRRGSCYVLGFWVLGVKILKEPL